MPSCLQPDKRLGRSVPGYGRIVLIRQEKEEALLPNVRQLASDISPRLSGRLGSSIEKSASVGFVNMKNV